MSSVLWWMPARCNPRASDHNSDQMVKLHGYDSRATAGGMSDDARSLLAPLEVPRPLLTAGVEQSDTATRERVSHMCLCSFEAVTHPTREPQVFFLIGASPCLGNDVVNLQKSKDVLLRTLAISTAISGLRTYAGPNVIRHRAGAHGSNGSRSPRRTASCSAWAFRNNPS